MAIPNTPQSGDNEPLLFLVYNNAGANAAALLSGAFATTVNLEKYAELKAYGTSGLLENGAVTTASGSAIALASTIPCQGVLVKADRANAGPIYVGKSDVTVSGTAATDGWELLPGESVAIPCRDVAEVYIRAAGSGYRAMWIASKDG